AARVSFKVFCSRIDKIKRERETRSLFTANQIKPSLTDWHCALGGFLLRGTWMKGLPPPWWAAATPSKAGRCAFAVAFVFGPGGQDCGGIHTGKLL
ncbi:hypothetical protein, partial [Acidovorax sp.]|uniref:hypothetical protein n=1 Tax=Acidovorax sp. TaxID=1872122 RepID=UPI002584B792